MQIAKLPHEQIGHMWYDYETTEFWTELLNAFLDDRQLPTMPKGGKL